MCVRVCVCACVHMRERVQAAVVGAQEGSSSGVDVVASALHVLACAVILNHNTQHGNITNCITCCATALCVMAVPYYYTNLNRPATILIYTAILAW